MKKLILLPLLLIFFTVTLTAQRSGKHSQYAEFLGDEEKIVEVHYQYVLTKLPNGNFRFRKFYPETKQLVQQTDFQDKKMKRPVGKHQTWYDNGAREHELALTEYQLSGPYREYHPNTDGLKTEGNYVRGEIQGAWRTYFDNGQVETVQTFKNGKLHGPVSTYDREGELIWEGVYENNVFVRMVSGNRPPQPTIHYPTFPGCGTYLSPEESKQCFGEEVMRYLYGNLRYRKLTKQEIEGTVVITAYVDETGSITNYQVLHGVTQELEAEMVRLIEEMPQLNPGRINGEVAGMPVNINFTFVGKNRVSR